MKKPERSSYNLKMRTATQREPRVEETVVYHWGRILGALVSLLLVAFVVYWFFSASTGSSQGDPDNATGPVAAEPEVGGSVSGTIQRSSTDTATESDTAMDASPRASQADEESSPFADSTSQSSDSPAGANTDEQAGTELTGIDQTDPGTGTDQGEASQGENSHTGQASSTAQDASEVPAEAAPTVAEPDAGASTAAEPESSSTPPASVIDDPADHPAPTDDQGSAVATSDPSSGTREDGMAQLDIASSHLQRVQLTWELRDREPTTALPAIINLGSREVIRVYFFNELQGLKGQTVYHDWYLNGERVARVDIDAFLDRMRASSGKYINRDMLGDWRVEAVTDSGTVLGSGSFSVTQ